MHFWIINHSRQKKKKGRRKNEICVGEKRSCVISKCLDNKTNKTQYLKACFLLLSFRPLEQSPPCDVALWVSAQGLIWSGRGRAALLPVLIYKHSDRLNIEDKHVNCWCYLLLLKVACVLILVLLFDKTCACLLMSQISCCSHSEFSWSWRSSKELFCRCPSSSGQEQSRFSHHWCHQHGQLPVRGSLGRPERRWAEL